VSPEKKEKIEIKKLIKSKIWKVDCS